MNRFSILPDSNDAVGFATLGLPVCLRQLYIGIFALCFCLAYLLPGALTPISPGLCVPMISQAPRPMVKMGQSRAAGDTAITIRNLDAFSFPSIGVHCTVSISGVPAHGMTRKDFSLLEGTREVENFEISVKGVPLDIAMVLDTSGSVRDFVKEIKAGARLFVDQMKSSDRASVVEFSDSVIQTQPLTSDRALLASAIDEIRATGGTKLYDGIMRGLSDLDPGRGVLVVMTDGRDVRRSGDTQRYSDADADAALAEALRRKTPVFAIGVGDDIDREGLGDMARKTGGVIFQTLDPSGIADIFEKISRAINCHYLITYSSPVPESSGEWRKVEVRATNGGASADAEYCVPLPPELAAKTLPIDTLRLYGFFGTSLSITPHDKDHLVAEVRVLGSDERFLSRLTSEIEGKTLSMMMRGGKGTGSGGEYRDGKGTGARVFHLVSGQKFFIVDEGQSMPVYDLKVPSGCSVEIYGASCPVEIGDTEGPLTVMKRAGTSSVTAGKVGPLTIVSHGTSPVQVAEASGRVMLVTQGTSNITVESGAATELFISISGTGDVSFKGFATEAEILCQGTGDVFIGALENPPRRSSHQGVGSVTIAKGKGSIDWDPLRGRSLGDASFSIPMPEPPPFPGIGPFWGASGDEVLVPNTDMTGFGEDAAHGSDTGNYGAGFEMPEITIPDIEIPDGSDYSDDGDFSGDDGDTPEESDFSGDDD